MRVTKTNEGIEKEEDYWLALPTPEAEDDNGPAVVSDDEGENEENYHPSSIPPANPIPNQNQDKEHDLFTPIEDDVIVPVSNPFPETHLMGELKCLSIDLNHIYDNPDATQALNTVKNHVQAPIPTAI